MSKEDRLAPEPDLVSEPKPFTEFQKALMREAMDNIRNCPMGCLVTVPGDRHLWAYLIDRMNKETP